MARTLVSKVLTSGVLLGIAGMAGTAAAQGAIPSVYGNHSGQMVTCESRDGRYRHCPMPTRGGVQMVRQVSRAQCLQGRSWGVDAGGVWVDRGCRAQFVANSGYRGGNAWGQSPDWRGQGQNLRCESINGRYRECRVDGRGNVQLLRQLSSAQCIEGRSWGRNRSGVWVNHGCRADFVVGGQSTRGNRGWQQPGRGWGNTGQQLVHCASDRGQQQYCPIPARRNVSLQRQVSRAACIQGRTWGWDARGIWVNGGCRADFIVH